MAKKSNRNKNNTVFVLPDDAIRFIVSSYVEQRTSTSGVPVLVGIPPATVEEVLGLFLNWAGRKGHLKDGVLTLRSE